MLTCPFLTRLWILSLARAELDDWDVAIAFRALDAVPRSARS